MVRGSEARALRRFHQSTTDIPIDHAMAAYAWAMSVQRNIGHCVPGGMDYTVDEWGVEVRPKDEGPRPAPAGKR